MKEEEEEEEEEEEQDFFKTKNERRRKAFWVVSLTNPSRRQGVHRLAFHRLAFLGGHCSKFTILCDGLLVVLVELAQEANFLVRFPTMRIFIICVQLTQTRRASSSRELVYELVYRCTNSVAYERTHKQTCTPCKQARTHARTHRHTHARTHKHTHILTHVRTHTYTPTHLHT